MNVVHIASGDLWAGAEVMLYTLVKALRNEFNVSVNVILLNHGTLENKLLESKIPTFVIDESRHHAIHISQQLNKLIANIKPDVIHTHRLKENILGSIAAWRNSTPSLRTLHGAQEHRPPIYKLAKRLLQSLDWFTARFYQRYVVAVSAPLAKQLKDIYPETKVLLIENGIDIEALLEVNSPPRRSNGNKHRIGIVGRLMPVKRVDLFIKAAILLRHRHPELNLAFYIYGDGPLRDTLERQVKAAKAENHIHFEGHREDILEQIKNLNALVMPSDHEGLPMTLLEAMCLNTPIIAHAVGGITALLDDGKCGTLVRKHTAEAYAEAIKTVVQQPDLCKKLSQLALERAQQHFSAKQTAEKYLSAYKKLISI